MPQNIPVASIGTTPASDGTILIQSPVPSLLDISEGEPLCSPSSVKDNSSLDNAHPDAVASSIDVRGPRPLVSQPSVQPVAL